MKTTILILLLAAAAAWARDKNSADYPLTAHVLSATGVAVANPLDKTTPFTVRYQIGNLIYTAAWKCHKHVQVGTDVNVRVEKSKLHILDAEGKSCVTRVESVIETK